ncbi:hypothetical protein CEXT_353361 [Caerostris extrusa]|uniref:Uncharacterized protein n=1 Tax=Caerostris extrusa TaxID=172846 RepID=A0AAV4R1A2_CAEEX|nr:hypothetical protein CEXT_353361 [Caerostris extrusa]
MPNLHSQRHFYVQVPYCRCKAGGCLPCFMALGDRETATVVNGVQPRVLRVTQTLMKSIRCFWTKSISRPFYGAACKFRRDSIKPLLCAFLAFCRR